MPSSSRLDTSFLDGLRGLAALWVLIGHALILTGVKVSLLSSPHYAVDLFILISGFLMAFNYLERRAKEPWQQPSTWTTFWVRRFFRIAPLYYVLLAAALIVGPWLSESRDAIAGLAAGTQTPSARYLDRSVANIAMHVSFLFGLSPTYHFRTALPDWSLGLEMQYYAVFPFLMLLIAKTGWARGIAVLAALGVAAALLSKAAGLHFDEPSLLALKLHIFLAGMLAAGSIAAVGRRKLVASLAACVLMALPLDGSPHSRQVVRFGIAAVFVLLLHRDALAGAAGRTLLRHAAQALSSRVGHVLGELSYGLYLVHLLVLIPVCGWLAVHHAAWSGGVRLAAALAVAVPLSYLLAAIGHVAFEKPGIALGRRWVGKRRVAAPAASSSPTVAG
ncbi:MAG TPA: acyltransferase [Burkholderiaceae bacterium]|nr:acyltransferase [Burkholderiaceae bacterium]